MHEKAAILFKRAMRLHPIILNGIALPVGFEFFGSGKIYDEGEELIKFSLYFPFLLSYICFSLALFPLLRNLNGAYMNFKIIF